MLLLRLQAILLELQTAVTVLSQRSFVLYIRLALPFDPVMVSYSRSVLQ